jgi:hypothetical protein
MKPAAHQQAEGAGAEQRHGAQKVQCARDGEETGHGNGFLVAGTFTCPWLRAP